MGLNDNFKVLSVRQTDEDVNAIAFKTGIVFVLPSLVKLLFQPNFRLLLGIPL